MTTARQRYEAKTKVVSFRMLLEELGHIEKTKAKSGLSNADLMKLGAGIAEEEIKKKLAQMSGLEAKLAKFRQAIQNEEQTLNQERERRRKELDKEIKAYRLFSAGWGVSETALKLGITEERARGLFEEWAEVVEDKEAARQELLRGYLKKHLEKLKGRRLWMLMLPSYTEKDRAELEEQIEYCGYLLSHPAKVSKESEQFLITEYSTK